MSFSQIFILSFWSGMIYSHGEYAPGNWINNWEFQACRDESEMEKLMGKMNRRAIFCAQLHRKRNSIAASQNKVCCRTIGFDELAHDVLEIAKVMTDKPVKKDGSFYDLDESWDEIPAEAKVAL